MIKLILKTIAYTFLILLVLEVIVRVFHLYNEDPHRFIDDLGVEKRVPNKSGYAVTGNRNQNYSEFKINDQGFNCIRNFNPSNDTKEIALVGDSFIEGFHQDYYDSLGQKVEKILANETEVYEYGYAGYDFANQLHLTQAYAEDFSKIDHIVIYLDYATDLERDEYIPNQDRVALLSSPFFKLRERVKLLSYASKIGLLDLIKKLAIRISSKQKHTPTHKKKSTQNKDVLFLNNFKTLCSKFSFDTTKTYLLLDSRVTPLSFLTYCDSNSINYIDYGKKFEASSEPTILIYDQHWNNHGRNIIAELISESLH